MDPDFWHERWETNRIGFHSNEVNTWLLRYWPELGFEAGARILVPLCGKSLDLLWLHKQGHHVIGIELSRLAIETFFTEHGIVPDINRSGRYTRWRHAGLELLCGDFLELQDTDIGPVAGIYDRAALIALPAAMRHQYAARLAKLARRNTRALLITLEYDQAEMTGPPFSVSQEEVEHLFGTTCKIGQVACADVLETSPQFRERGLSELRERAYRLDFQ
jgi:thiopurine S-methyltransferase